MRAFFANLVFTMIVSALWSLCFEMPFMTVDSILLSGRKQNLSKDLKTCDSTTPGREICQSKKSSIMYVNDNPGEGGCGVTHYDLMKTAKKDGAEWNVGKIYCINPSKCDETWSVVNFDNSRSDYVNVDLCRIFDKCGQPKACSSGKQLELIDNDPIHKTTPNHSG